MATTATRDPIDTLVLQEFRLHAADTTGEAARIVASFSGGIESSVPLLTSIDDRRDVATVRAMHAGEPTDVTPGERAALEPLVESWQPLKSYRPRITERSARPPSRYRLAVTESGVNNAEADLPATPRAQADVGISIPLVLMWIGVPLATYAGLLMLLGDDDRPSAWPAAPDWPLPLSGPLGVRIYEGRV
jgi:hypothetical protein